MGFIIAKTILYLALPPAGPLILAAAGFLVLRRCRGLGRFLIASGFILLYLLSINPVSNALLKPLETSAPPWKNEKVRADAIVVLGGGVKDLSWLKLPSEPSCSALERVVLAVRLYRALHVPLVFVGGNGDPARTTTPEADVLAHAARALGVPARDIRIENKSKNTIEGARALKDIISGKRLVLVTSAFHMKRSSALFAKQGFTVFPAPAGYKREEQSFSLYSFLPRAGNLDSSSTAIAEYLSLFWHTLKRDI